MFFFAGTAVFISLGTGKTLSLDEQEANNI
jgi:hypothetical protein